MAVMIKLGARLRAARKAAGFKTAKEFLKKHRFPASTYSQHESGARLPEDKILRFYSKTFDVNYDWLKSGKGLPYQQINSTQKKLITNELTTLINPKNQGHQLNKKLLCHIINNVFKIHQIKLVSTKSRNISQDISDIYADCILSGKNEASVMRSLKSVLAEYKKMIVS